MDDILNSELVSDFNDDTFMIEEVILEDKAKPVTVELKEQETPKPDKLLCLNDGCTRKALKGTSLCRKCTKAKEEIVEDEKKKEIIMEGKEVAVNSLFGMHYALYLNLEFLAKVGNVDLEGLPDDLLKNQEQFKNLYGQVYEKYGPDGIEDYIGPGYALALMSIGQVGSRYAQNLKKNSSAN
jgi:hypothetical protein